MVILFATSQYAVTPFCTRVQKSNSGISECLKKMGMKRENIPKFTGRKPVKYFGSFWGSWVSFHALVWVNRNKISNRDYKYTPSVAKLPIKGN